MKKFKTLSFLVFISVILSGCNAHTRELKSPCGPQAGLSNNPCNPLPINIAAIPELPGKAGTITALS